MSQSRTHFVHQQGFACDAASSGPRFSALMFQPRIIALIVMIGILNQSWRLFLVLGCILAWSALFPRWNPFEAVYNAFLAGRNGRIRLEPAPAPRRFAQGMAAAFMLGIALSLRSGQIVLAYVLEALLAAALIALVAGRFCLGSYVFHLGTGRRTFANSTLPWK